MKQKEDVLTKDIKGWITEGRLILGTETTLKHIRKGAVEQVLVSANCEEKALETLQTYCGMQNIPLHKAPVQNDELGTICKKPFSVSVIAVKKNE